MNFDNNKGKVVISSVSVYVPARVCECVCVRVWVFMFVLIKNPECTPF